MWGSDRLQWVWGCIALTSAATLMGAPAKIECFSWAKLSAIQFELKHDSVYLCNESHYQSWYYAADLPCLLPEVAGCGHYLSSVQTHNTIVLINFSPKIWHLPIFLWYATTDFRCTGPHRNVLFIAFSFSFEWYSQIILSPLCIQSLSIFRSHANLQSSLPSHSLIYTKIYTCHNHSTKGNYLK